MRVCIYATTFQADVQAFALHLEEQPGVEVLLAVESEAAIRKQAIESFSPLEATLVEHGHPRIRELVRAFGADVVVIDNHIPAFETAPRALVLWHGYGWRLDDLAQMRKELQHHWGDVTRSNPNVLWAAFGGIDWEHRTSHSGLHPANVEKLGAPYSDLLVPDSAFQRSFSRAAVARYYDVDITNRKNVLVALTWHHGSALGNFGDDSVLLDRLFAALDARNANVIMRMHDRHRFEPAYLENLDRIAARHRNVQLKFKNECPDALVDLSVSDVMVSNYSSILNHFYFLERPTVHIDPADASGRFTEFQWKRGKLRKRVGTAAKDVWKVPPDDIGGLHAASFPELLDAVSRALDEPDCCREASTSFVRKHYTGADGRSCERVLEAIRRRWTLT